jgi:hypothetical protein
MQHLKKMAMPKDLFEGPSFDLGIDDEDSQDNDTNQEDLSLLIVEDSLDQETNQEDLSLLIDEDSLHKNPNQENLSLLTVG